MIQAENGILIVCWKVSVFPIPINNILTQETVDIYARVEKTLYVRQVSQYT